MKGALAIALLLTVGVGAATARGTPTLSVAEVIARHEALDGKFVRVRGWIGVCHGRSCPIYETRAGAEGRGAEAGWLSIGTAPVFDRQVRSSGPVQVELEARVRDVCFGDATEGVIAVCADRVEQLRRPRLIRILSRSTAN